jgi:hypothetical protein
MASWDRDLQKMITMAGVRKEIGTGVTIAGVSGQDFTVATKLRKVIAGHGIMDTDAMTALATTGLVSSGQVTFSRYGPISTSADTLTYDLYGY